MPEWSKVDFLGFLSREDVMKTYGKAQIGIVIIQPEPHYMESLPVKMFEYMAAGLPVIASNFPFWAPFIKEADCGILVDPTSVDEVSAAMNRLLENLDEAKAMGERGRQLVVDRYNWKNEFEKLHQLYQEILAS